MTIKELKAIFNWVCNNYEVKDIDNWHPSPLAILEEFMEDHPIVIEQKEAEKKDVE